MGWSDPLGRAFLVWGSQDDGSVWAAAVNTTSGSVDAPQQLDAGTGSTAHMELASDADGVYWCNHGTGRVTRWGPSDNAVFDVGMSASPHSLATDATRVYWTGPVDRKLYRAAKQRPGGYAARPAALRSRRRIASRPPPSRRDSE